MATITDRELRALRHPGNGVARPVRFRAGPGLYLQIAAPPRSPDTKEEAKGAKSWVFRFMLARRSREMGMGPYPDVTLAQATEQAAAARALVRAGRDPIDDRGAQRAREAAEDAARLAAEQEVQAAALRAVANPFRDVAKAAIADRRGEWRNAKHAKEWTSSLTNHAFPVLGDLGVAQIEREHVLAALLPIWKEKAETARRVRARIEAVLEFAVSREMRTDGPNPASMDVLGRVLRGGKTRLAKRVVRSHPALPFERAAAFMAALEERDGIAAKALAFTVLTAARSGETRGAKWSEIDEAARMWRIPGDRMKAGREHRVPLSAAALEILAGMKDLAKGPDSYVFPGERRGKPLSVMALEMVLRRMNPEPAEGEVRPWIDRKGEAITVHGFRSAFKDWSAEVTTFPREMAEMALAHRVGDKVEMAYRRMDMFAKRQRMMDAWAGYCGRAGGAKVVALRRAG